MIDEELEYWALDQILAIVGVVVGVAVLAVRWLERRRAPRYDGVPLRTVRGPVLCGSCGARWTTGDPGHPASGPVTAPTPGCRTCARFLDNVQVRA